MFSFAIFFPWRTLDLQLAPFCSSSPRAISCIGGPLLLLPPPSSNAVYQFLPLCFLPVSCLGAIPYPSSLSFPLRAIPYLSSSYLWIRRRFEHRRIRQSYFIKKLANVLPAVSFSPFSSPPGPFLLPKWVFAFSSFSCPGP